MTMNKKHHCLMIGGGIQEREAVTQLQFAGWIVGVTDRNSDCAAADVADYLLVADGTDAEKIIQCIVLNKQCHGLPEVIFTLTELTTTVSIVSEALGLFGASTLSSAISQSKAASKQIWLEAEVSTPEGQIHKQGDDPEQHRVDSHYPRVVKPDIGFGGKGISVVTDQSELRAAIKKALEYSRSRYCVVERKIPGTLHDANAVFTPDGTFHPLNISDRSWANEISVEQGIHSPTSLNQENQAELMGLFEAACRVIGLERGPVKLDVMKEGERFYVLEVASRLHGPRNSVKAVPATFGRPLIPEVMRAIVDTDPPNWDVKGVEQFVVSKRIASNQFGTIKQITGLEHVAKLAPRVEANIYKKPGDIIKIPENSSEVIGYFFAVGDNSEACTKAIEAAEQALDIHIV